jgi:hypothetical protein
VTSSAPDITTITISPITTITTISMAIIISIKLQAHLMVQQQQVQCNLMEVQRLMEAMVVMVIITIIRYHHHHILITTQSILTIIHQQESRYLQRHSNHRSSSNLPHVEYSPNSKQRRQSCQDSVLTMFLRQPMFFQTMET